MRPTPMVLAAQAATVLMCLTIAAEAEAAFLTTDSAQYVSSTVMLSGAEVDHHDANNTFGRAESRAEHGSLLTTGARTAARSAADEIAANAQFSDGAAQFSFNQYNASSTAEYNITAQSLFPQAHDVMLDFFLPPTLLEIQTNLETGPINPPSTASVSASLTVFLPDGGFEFFDFAASLTAGYTFDGSTTSFEYELTDDARTGFVTDLDLTALENPTITVAGEGEFVTTVTVEYPAFAGQLQLGPVAPGEELDVSYDMSAEVEGVAAYSAAIAAINDPFFLSTDPVIVSPLVEAVDGGIVPEPSTVALSIALAVGLAAGAFRVRRSGCGDRISAA